MELGSAAVVAKVSEERATHLCGCSAKNHESAAAGGGVYSQTLRLEPTHDAHDLCRKGAEAIGEFFGRQPLTVIERGWILLIAQQVVEGVALRGAAAERQRHVTQHSIAAYRPAIILGLHPRIDGCGQRDHSLSPQRYRRKKHEKEDQTGSPA